MGLGSLSLDFEDWIFRTVVCSVRLMLANVKRTQGAEVFHAFIAASPSACSYWRADTVTLTSLRIPS